MEVMELRRARDEDVPALAGIYRRAVEALGPARYTPEQVRAWAVFAEREAAFGEWIAGAETWVALAVPEAGGAAGVAGFGGIAAREGHLRSLYVDPGYARRGIGAALIGRLIERARQTGCTRVYTEASAFSRLLFARHGFAVVEEEVVEREGVRFVRWKMARVP